MARWAHILFLTFLAASCRFPGDPRGTLDNVIGAVMRVGVLPDEPWVRWKNGGPQGIEADLIRAFAKELDARVEWVAGSTHELLEGLRRWRLDLVIGGITEDSPWAQQVGFTRPIYETAWVVAAREPMPLDSIEGRRVAVELTSWLAAKVEDEGGVPVKPDAEPSPQFRVLPEWAIGDGWFSTGFTLAETKRVMAIPSGENAWLMRLERFLKSRREKVTERLRRGGAA